jgi:thiamine-phosphate diphosphorylase
VPAFAGRPILYLVTDRRRLAREPGAAANAAVAAQVRAAAAAGVDWVQVRERDLSARELLALVECCLEAVAGTSARVLVNDRVDVALAAAAHGVHLRGDSIEAPRVRDVAPPGFLVGRSVHDEAEARLVAARGGLDFLVLGTVFGTVSKPAGTPALGLGVLGRVCEVVDLPVLAIGGVSLDRLPGVIAAGAAGAAAIGLFLGGEGGLAAVAEATRRARAAADAAMTLRQSGKLSPDEP